MGCRAPNKPPSQRRAAAQTEAQVRDPTVKWAKRSGWKHKRMHFGRGCAAGWPDDLFYRSTTCGSVSIWIEFKAPGKKATALQAHVHTEMQKDGLLVYVCDGFDSARAALT